jgi:hypothetical protein
MANQRPGAQHEREALELLRPLIERAVTEAERIGGHYHTGRSNASCGSPDCLGKHPLLALAAACRRVAKECKDSLKHKHVWTEFGDITFCGICGQTTYEEDEQDD